MSVRLPNFVVVGAPKCGTTSLYYYLRQHPDVYLPERKELHYFSFRYMRQFVAGPGDAYILTTIAKNQDEYAAYYADVTGQTAVGDISPSYFYYADVSRDIHAALGDPRIILMLRDPVQKAFSQYMHLIRDNRETLDFASALRAEQGRIGQGYAAMWRYAESSLFTQRIRRYLDEFGRDRVKFVLFDDLARSPQRVLEEIFEFLGVDPHVSVRLDSTYNRSGVPRSRWMANLISKPNPATSLARRVLPVAFTTKLRDVLQRANTGAKPALDGKSREYLERYFSQDQLDLDELLGRRLPWHKSGPSPGSDEARATREAKA